MSLLYRVLKCSKSFHTSGKSFVYKKPSETLFDSILEKPFNRNEIPLIKNEISIKPSRFVFVNNKLMDFEIKTTPNSKKSKRTGTVGINLGMTSLWLSKDGSRVPISLVQIKECQVIESLIPFEYGGNSPIFRVIVGGKNMSEDDINRTKPNILYYFDKIGVHPKEKYCSFSVNEDGMLPMGTKLNAAHYAVGQKLLVTGLSKDKGFQGVMRRWGMKGGPATHGNSLNHRTMGAIGGIKNRVYPGKRMPGHTGLENRSMMNAHIVRINYKFNILYLLGSIPGYIGKPVVLRDMHNIYPENLFPTFHGNYSDLPEEVYDPIIQPIDKNFSFVPNNKK